MQHVRLSYRFCPIHYGHEMALDRVSVCGTQTVQTKHARLDVGRLPNSQVGVDQSPALTTDD